MSKIYVTRTEAPEQTIDKEYRYDSFALKEGFEDKKHGRLPAMGWNSWNAFGTENNEGLTRITADRMIELGLDKYGYKYVVLDDGCYNSERKNDRLSPNPVRFPSGFEAISEYVHSKGLKFGMYNDIGTKLCSGLEVGTNGHEDIDCEDYIRWNIDYLKVDNCYYPWDNATFSNAENARFTFAPRIKCISVLGKDVSMNMDAVKDGYLFGRGVSKRDGFVQGIGTLDGTGTGVSPLNELCGELRFDIEIPEGGEYNLTIVYATGKENEIGEWLQIAVGEGENTERFFDGLLPETPNSDTFAESKTIKVNFKKGANILRLMNHRRRENVVLAYAAVFNSLLKAKQNHDIVLSLCEWGKNQPHTWGHKMGNSWRILNDITFQVGTPQNPGTAKWIDEYTNSITSQYDKAVVMDEFAGLDKGWNDPDMLVIGMDGITRTMEKTHMTMWCMMNSPLMLGMDLRNVKEGDEVYRIITNERLIALNQDALGVQAKRIYCSLEPDCPDKKYITNHERADILAKPLSDGDVALSFINLSDKLPTYKFLRDAEIGVDVKTIMNYIGDKIVDKEAFEKSERFLVTNLWDEQTRIVSGQKFIMPHLDPCDNITIRITPMD